MKQLIICFAKVAPLAAGGISVTRVLLPERISASGLFQQLLFVKGFVFYNLWINCEGFDNA